MEPVSCPHSPFRAASARPPCGGRRRLWDFCTDSRAPWPLRFCLAGSYTNFEARRHVVGGHRTIPTQAPRGGRTLKNGAVAPQSQHHLRAASARKPHGLHTISDWRLRRLHGNLTEIARVPYNLHAASVRIYRGFAPEGPYTKPHDARRQCEHVRRSHLRCPKNARKIVDKFIARGQCELSIRTWFRFGLQFSRFPLHITDL